ncbi:MAG TPA: hypothetical protein VGR21_07905, partial [Cryptosporangiaceae bacterium]|nr:hypothetical protein [Cryptosporangiaceae bacterium]
AAPVASAVPHVQVDLADTAATELAVAEAADALGGLDAVVTAAGSTAAARWSTSRPPNGSGWCG